MIDYLAIAAVTPVFLLALISPGPDFMIVSSLSLSRGREDGIQAAFGIATIIAFYSFISLTGLSALFVRYGWMVAAIKLCGGLYLIYLGIMLARAGGSAPQETPTAKKRSAYATGVITCLTNPKAIAFFASIFALGLKPDTNTATKIVLAAIPPIATALWFTLVATGLAQPRIRAAYLKRQRALNRGIGAILAVFGVRLALGARG